MRREVIATVSLAAGLIGFTLGGLLISNGYVQNGIIVTAVTVIVVAVMLAYGSLRIHH
jgi:hypothetical protein